MLKGLVTDIMVIVPYLSASVMMLVFLLLFRSCFCVEACFLLLCAQSVLDVCLLFNYDEKVVNPQYL